MTVPGAPDREQSRVSAWGARGACCQPRAPAPWSSVGWLCRSCSTAVSIRLHSSCLVCRGLPSQAFEYILYNKGLMGEDAYPYRAQVPQAVRLRCQQRGQAWSGL